LLEAAVKKPPETAPNGVSISTSSVNQDNINTDSINKETDLKTE